MGRKVPITTAITEDHIRDLEGLRLVTRKARAVLIREAIDEYLGSRRYLIPVRELDPRQGLLDLSDPHRACGSCPECVRGSFDECTYYDTVPA